VIDFHGVGDLRATADAKEEAPEFFMLNFPFSPISPS
jgi:hypothetical protein